MGSAALIAASMIAACADTSEPQLGESESAVISGSTNVALTGTASASSVYTGYPVTNANDGDASTMWQSGNIARICPPRVEDCEALFTTPTWLKVTFDSPKTIYEISVRFSSEFGAYDLQYCPASTTCGDEGSGWVTPPYGQFTSYNYPRAVLNPAVEATAVRVVYYSAYASRGRAQAFELEAWTYPDAWNNGGYNCNAVCNSTTPWNTECRHETILKHTTCGEYGIYAGCKSWCDGDLGLLRACSASCTAPDGTTSTCGASGFECYVDQMGQQTPLCKDVCTYQASAHYTFCKMYSSSNYTTNCQEYGTYAPPETIRGSVSTSGGSDVNRCAFGLELQVNLMPSNDTAGSIYYSAGDLGFDPWCGDGHWQGIQRLTNDPTRFVMSASNKDSLGRLAHGTIPDGGAMARTGVAQSVVQGLTTTATDHPGGMQALGNWVFVGIEWTDGDSDPAYVQQWSIGPSGLAQVGGSYNLGPHGASAVAITKLRPMAGEVGSRFLMLVPRYGDSSVLEFYLTPPGVSLASGLGSFYLAGTTNMRGGGEYTNGWMGFSNVNFVTDCNGDLYLFGMTNTDNWCGWTNTGDDWMKVYRISYQFDPLFESLQVGLLSTPVAEKHVFLSGNSNLAAASGIYVTPANMLVLMATEHTKSSSFGSGIDVSEISVP